MGEVDEWLKARDLSATAATVRRKSNAEATRHRKTARNGQELITVINLPSFWRVPRAGLPPPDTRTRKIKGGPLIELAALQEAIRSEAVSEDSVDVVNKRCDDELDKLKWTLQDVLDCLLCAIARDFKGSEWCDTSSAGRLPCDAYAIPYDEIGKCRAPAALEFYLKFSLDEGHTLRVQMVRVHLSR